MSILDNLSSQVGDRSEEPNREAALLCLDHPALLAEIAAGLHSDQPALVGDCAEVFTLVAEQQPDWVTPYIRPLADLLTHPAARVRWEAVHALALTAASEPKAIDPLLPMLDGLICADPSVIVRDYATDALAAYASTGKAAAEKAYPLLKDALTSHGGKHAARALRGMVFVAKRLPALHAELAAIARKYAYENRTVVRKAARALLKAVTPK